MAIGLSSVLVMASLAASIPYARTSDHVAMSDGTRLAVDIYRPTSGGRLPVLLTMTPYGRARRDSAGAIVPDPSAVYFASNGYVVAIADVRGKGASFGTRRAPSDAVERRDAHDLIEWLAKQPWSDGQVAMQGCSYLGSTVMQGLLGRAPHLKAAVVGSTAFDMMNAFTEGGAPRARPLADEGDVDGEIARAVPVDTDSDGSQLKATRADKLRNNSVSAIWRSAPFRDSVSPLTGDRYWQTSSVYPGAKGIRESGIPVFYYGSWHDPFALETISAWASLKTESSSLLLGHGAHCQSPNFDRDAAVLQFFSRVLKGRGADTVAPPVRYYLEGGDPGHEWRTAAAWPPKSTPLTYRLSSEGGTGRLAGADGGAGSLTVTPRDDVLPFTNFSVVRSGIDPLSVTFTSAPWAKTGDVVGSPVVDLWVSAPAQDYVVQAFLEHVAPTRDAEVIARGRLLASRRKLGPAPYDNGGLPYATQLAADVQPVTPGKPVRLRFPLSPIARRIAAGESVRLAVTIRTSRTDPLLPVTVWFGDGQSSSIELPVAVEGAGS